MRRALLFLAACGLGSAPAQAAIAPCHLDQMVRTAPTVAQVAVEAVEGPDRAGRCVLGGPVVRSFSGALAVGEAVAVPFACENPQGITGGTTYHDRREVARAAMAEVHLDADGTVAGHGWGLLLLDGATDEPAFAFEHLPPPGGRC